MPFAVSHGLDAIGYALREDGRPGRFEVDAGDALGVPDGPARGALQRGRAGDALSGRVVRPEEVVGSPRRGRTIVVTGDTAPAKSVVEAATGADVLVHEATFLADERARARETEHSTAGEAALVAREADVGLLALTHLSARYAGSEVADEACQLFPRTVVPRDFDVVVVPLPERGARSSSPAVAGVAAGRSSQSGPPRERSRPGDGRRSVDEAEELS